MVFSLKVPGIMTLAIVRHPPEVAAAVDARGVDRALSGRGGLVNRMVAAKLAVFKTPAGAAWPAFGSRGDRDRAHRQDHLDLILSTGEALARIGPEIAALADCVLGVCSVDEIGIAVQRAVGRLFFAGYEADAQSYAAARTLTNWPSAGPLKSWRLRRSGELQRAIDLIMARAQGDTACAHATALAMHNIVESVSVMQRLARAPGSAAQLSPADAVKRALRAPPRIVREARDSIAIGRTRLHPRSLVFIAVDSARKASGDDGLGFFAGHWNQCPAHALVPDLLARIWQAAAAKSGAGS